MRKVIAYISVFLVSLLSVTTPVHAITTIAIKDQAKVEGYKVILGDIAKISGNNAHSLSRIVIALFPPDQGRLNLSRRYIKDKIEHRYKDKVRIDGADKVSITRSYVNISRERLKDIFTKELLTKNPWPHKGKIKITNFSAPMTVKIPQEMSKTYCVKFPNRSRFIGPTSAFIIFGKVNSKRKVIHTSAFISFSTEIPVASHTIRRGCIITSDDLKMKYLDISRLPVLVMDTKDCIGMRAKTYIKKDRPILAANIEKPPAISRGQVVLIEAQGNNIVVSDKGVALRDGYIKQTIPVKNLTSGRQILGMVVGSSRVRVEF